MFRNSSRWIHIQRHLSLIRSRNSSRWIHIQRHLSLKRSSVNRIIPSCSLRLSSRLTFIWYTRLHRFIHRVIWSWFCILFHFRCLHESTVIILIIVIVHLHAMVRKTETPADLVPGSRILWDLRRDRRLRSIAFARAFAVPSSKTKPSTFASAFAFSFLAFALRLLAINSLKGLSLEFSNINGKQL